MRPSPAFVVLGLFAALGGCSARQVAADDAAARCRDQAIGDTSELPGSVAGPDREGMVRACLARHGA